MQSEKKKQTQKVGERGEGRERAKESLLGGSCCLFFAVLVDLI